MIIFVLLELKILTNCLLDCPKISTQRLDCDFDDHIEWYSFKLQARQNYNLNHISTTLKFQCDYTIVEQAIPTDYHHVHRLSMWQT